MIFFGKSMKLASEFFGKQIFLRPNFAKAKLIAYYWYLRCGGMEIFMRKTLLGNLLLLLAAIIWGFAFVAQVLGVSQGVGPFTFNATRFFIGAMALLPVLLILGRKNRKSGEVKSGVETKKGVGEWKKLIFSSVFCGTMLFFAANLQQYALTVNSNPGLAGFITALYTVWTPVAYFLIFRKKTAINVWIAVGVSIAGFYLLCMTDGGGIYFGLDIVLLLISTLFWTAHILSVDKFIAEVDALKLSFGQYMVCSALTAILALIFEWNTFSLASVWGAKWSILYCGVLSVGVAYTLQVVGQRMTNPVFAVIIMSTESVLSAIGGVLWNLLVPVALAVDQDISDLGYVGCGVIFLGVIISQLDFSRFFRRRDSAGK